MTESEFQKRRKECAMRKADFLDKKYKLFWNESQLNRALEELKSYGFLQQPHKNGPYSLSTSYNVASSLATLANNVEETPLTRVHDLSFLGFICGLPESVLNREDEEELDRIENSLDSAVVELEKLRFRVLLRTCLEDPDNPGPELVRRRLVSFLYSFLGTMCEWSLNKEYAKDIIIGHPREWATESPLLPFRLQGATLIDFIGPEMQSMLRDSDWRRLAEVLKHWSEKRDPESEGLPSIRWKYRTFLREYQRPLITILNAHTDIEVTTDRRLGEMSLDHLSRVAESWCIHDLLEHECPRCPKRSMCTLPYRKRASRQSYLSANRLRTPEGDNSLRQERSSSSL